MELIPFSKVSIGPEEIIAVAKVMESGWLAAGPQTKAFEEEFAKFVGVDYAIFTNSCTSALKMAYKYYKEKGFTHYKTVENTFCATYSAAEEMGLEEAKGILQDEKTVFTAMHYGGEKSKWKWAHIEDSAHRIEPNDPLDRCECRTYSFYATKNMTTGTGGMFVTNSKEIYERVRLFWKDGLSTSTLDRATGGYDYEVLAYAGGYDGNDIAAAMGRVQLRRLPDFIKRRNAIVKKYNKAFKQDWEGNHLYPYFCKSTSEVARLIGHLEEKGIKTGYHYPGTGWLGVSLPLYPDLTNKEVDYIIESVKNFNG